MMADDESVHTDELHLLGSFFLNVSIVDFNVSERDILSIGIVL